MVHMQFRLGQARDEGVQRAGAGVGGRGGGHGVVGGAIGQGVLPWDGVPGVVRGGTRVIG
ncbi:hypothetical protein GCM10020256_19580 [Streptomyces thermocoprophilus]